MGEPMRAAMATKRKPTPERSLQRRRESEVVSKISRHRHGGAKKKFEEWRRLEKERGKWTP